MKTDYQYRKISETHQNNQDFNHDLFLLEDSIMKSISDKVSVSFNIKTFNEEMNENLQKHFLGT